MTFRIFGSMMTWGFESLEISIFFGQKSPSWTRFPILLLIQLVNWQVGKFLLIFCWMFFFMNACDPLLIHRTEQATPFDTCCLTARIGGTATFTTRLVTRTDVVASELGVAR